MIVGNDVSNWQGNINYDVYKNNSNFIIIKATEGIGYIDPKFYQNQIESRRVGLLRGYYHFARPDLGNFPEAEAEYFLQVVGTMREGEVLCLDYEPASNPQPVVDYCKRFMDRVLALTRVRCLIYLNQSQVRKYDWKPVVDASYGLWLAAYVPTSEAFTGQWNQMAMQQWTSSQIVPGIVGKTDGNWFFGDENQFKKYGYHDPVVPSSSVSPSISPSLSLSPSKSPSESMSLSPSASMSESPSPSEEIPEETLTRLAEVIYSKWAWFGKNVWYKKLQALKDILNEL